jgi:hypothetical protein
MVSILVGVIYKTGEFWEGLCLCCVRSIHGMNFR